MQLIKDKLTNLDNFLPLNYYKILNPPFLSLILEFQKKKKTFPNNVLYEILVASLPLQRGGGDYVAKQKEINKLVAVSWPLRWWGSLSASVKKGKSVLYQKDLAVVS